MSKHRQAARTDDNQADIVATLRRYGVAVEPGHDDIICAYKGVVRVYEIKDPEKQMLKCGRLRKGALTDAEINRQRVFQGAWGVAFYAEEILADFGIIKPDKTGGFWG